MTPARRTYALKRIKKLKEHISFCQRQLAVSFYDHTIKELRKAIASSRQAVRRWEKELRNERVPLSPDSASGGQ